MVELKDKTVEELRKMASRKKIEGRSKMNKSELVRALKKKTSTKKTMKRKKMRGGALTPQQVESLLTRNYQTNPLIYFYISLVGSPAETGNITKITRSEQMGVEYLNTYVNGKLKIQDIYGLRLENFNGNEYLVYGSRGPSNPDYIPGTAPVQSSRVNAPNPPGISTPGGLTPFTGDLAEFYNRELRPYQILILNKSLGMDVFSPVVYINPNTNNASMLNISFVLRNPAEVLKDDINIREYDIYNNNNTIRFIPAFDDIRGGLSRVGDSILLIPKGTRIMSRNYHLFPDIRLEEEYKGYFERPVNVSTITNYNARRETNFNPERIGGYFDNPVKINIRDILERGARYEGLEIRSISRCVKELIEFSYFLYNKILLKSHEQTPPSQISIVCGGQSPAYYALSMLNLSIYNPELVNVVIIPHSTGGGEWERSVQTEAQTMKYCERLREKGVTVYPKVYILDLVESGLGVKSLKKALQRCFGLVKENIKILAVKAYQNGPPRITVGNGLENTYDQYCFAFFRQMFKRIVPTYKPEQFNRQNLPIPNLEAVYAENPLARMIRDCSRVYPYVPIEETPWYRLNTEPH